MAAPTPHLRWQACQEELVFLKTTYEATLPILSVVPPSWTRPDGTLIEHVSDINHVAQSLEILMEHEYEAQTMRELGSLISNEKLPTSLTTSSSEHLTQFRAELKSINTLLTESSSHSSIDLIRKDEEAEILRRHLRTERDMVKRLLVDVGLLSSERFSLSSDTSFSH